MTCREDDAETIDGEDTEEREPRFLDEEGINPKTDEAFKQLIEQSIIDERRIMPDTQALKESTIHPEETFEQWLERVEQEQKGR